MTSNKKNIIFQFVNNQPRILTVNWSYLHRFTCYKTSIRFSVLASFTANFANSRDPTERKQHISRIVLIICAILLRFSKRLQQHLYPSPSLFLCIPSYSHLIVSFFVALFSFFCVENRYHPLVGFSLARLIGFLNFFTNPFIIRFDLVFLLSSLNYLSTIDPSYLCNTQKF